MSGVFVDTSALYALLVESDRNHRRAREGFAHLATRTARLITTSYVLVELYALLGRRVGLAAVGAFRKDFAPLLETVWVGSDLHTRAIDLLLARDTARLSLVDAVSFETMREHRVREAFAYDRDFVDEGFDVVGDG